ncbi:23S rRNA (guanosine(2251)-2'-O)-methyltransferase RlmB [Caldisericum sp. AR60]|uniref:23S rRNA (guanosine(2251)-2'-O)-methyltransferase RlmB n=1 Tax=Caldisericum sp. AR60 TaxID=3397852 RepID=UPI0039FDD851
MDKIKNEYFIIGRNPVLEALRAHYPIRLVIVQEGIDLKESVLNSILAHARKNDIQVLFRERSWFDRRFKIMNHQGVVAVGAPYEYKDISELKIKKNSLILILDRIQDPQNFGAIIRAAECAGVKDIIIQERESCDVTETVMSVSSGAVFHVSIYKVSNLAQAISELKENGVWIIGTDINAKDLCFEIDYKNHPFAFIMGNEGEGVRKGLLKECDYVVKIPMRGKVNSLNVSVATGIILFKAFEEKLKNGEYK